MIAVAAMVTSAAVVLAIGLATPAGYALLARSYGFITPQVGIGVALACYVISLVLAWT